MGTGTGTRTRSPAVSTSTSTESVSQSVIDWRLETSSRADRPPAKANKNEELEAEGERKMSVPPMLITKYWKSTLGPLVPFCHHIRSHSSASQSSIQACTDGIAAEEEGNLESIRSGNRNWKNQEDEEEEDGFIRAAH